MLRTTPQHSKLAALCLVVPPCLLFGLIVCFRSEKRPPNSTAVASPRRPSAEKAPLAPGSAEASRRGAVPAWLSLLAACSRGGAGRDNGRAWWGPVSAWQWPGLMATAKERVEKMSALGCSAEPGGLVAPRDTREPETASRTLLFQCFLVIWVSLTPGTCQVTSALTDLFGDARPCPARHAEPVWGEGWGAPGVAGDGALRAGAVLGFTALGYVLSQRGESSSSGLLAGGGGGVCCFPGAEGWVLGSRRCRAAISSAVVALEVCLK